MASNHQPSPKTKKKPSPWKSQTHVCQSNIKRFKIIQKKRGKRAPTWCPFPSSFGTELDALKGEYFQDEGAGFPSLMMVWKNWFSSLTSRYGICLQEKWSAATPRKNKKWWRRWLVLHIVHWSTANSITKPSAAITSRNKHWFKNWLRRWDKNGKDQEVCHNRLNQYQPRATITAAQHSGGPCSSSSWSLRSTVRR